MAPTKSWPEAGGAVCHPRAPRVVNTFSLRGGALPRSIVFPSSVAELFEDNRHGLETPVLGVRTLDNRVYLFRYRSSENEVPPRKKAKDTSRALSVLANPLPCASISGVIAMHQFPCVLCRNEVAVFEDGLKGKRAVWKVPGEVCGSLTEYVWVQDVVKVVPELTSDVTRISGNVCIGTERHSQRDLVLFGDSLGHVFWASSPLGQCERTENPQVFYTAETRDPICRIFVCSRDGISPLDTIIVVTSGGLVKVFWWKHEEPCCPQGDGDNNNNNNNSSGNSNHKRVEFQFEIKGESLSKSTVCCGNVKRKMPIAWLWFLLAHMVTIWC